MLMLLLGLLLPRFQFNRLGFILLQLTGFPLTGLPFIGFQFI